MGWNRAAENSPMPAFRPARYTGAEAPDPYHAITVDAVSLLTRAPSIICRGPVAGGGRGGINSLLNTTYIVIDSIIDRLTASTFIY